MVEYPRSKKMKFTNKLLASTFLFFVAFAFCIDGAKKNNPHYLSKKERNRHRALLAKYRNEIDMLHKRINYLKTELINKRAPQEDIQAFAASIRSAVEELFNEMNGHLSNRQIFPEDSKVFFGQIDAVRRSLDSLRI
jgi:chromosome segregation ATPase